MTSDCNELSSNSQVDPRMLDLRVWMIRNRTTFPKIGKALGGITGNGVQQLLKGKRISTNRHKELLDYGIPAHLLPPAEDVSKGRPSKVKEAVS